MVTYSNLPKDSPYGTGQFIQGGPASNTGSSSWQTLQDIPGFTSLTARTPGSPEVIDWVKGRNP